MMQNHLPRSSEPTIEDRWKDLGRGWKALWIIAAVLAFAFVFDLVASFVVTGQPPDWTGFGPETSAPTRMHIGIDQPAKRLWDWLQLLIIPGGVAVATIWFTRRDNDRRKEMKEAALETYLNSMFQVLHSGKPGSTIGDNPEALRIIQIRTAITMRRLDADQNKVLVEFLRDSGILRTKNASIDLFRANLKGADLRGVNFSGTPEQFVSFNAADLTAADLRGAYLEYATFVGADLRGAYLEYATFVGADLRGAYLNTRYS